MGNTQILFATEGNAVYTGEVLNIALGENFIPAEINLNLDDLTTQTWSINTNEYTQRIDGSGSIADNRQSSQEALLS